MAKPASRRFPIAPFQSTGAGVSFPERVSLPKFASAAITFLSQLPDAPTPSEFLRIAIEIAVLFDDVTVRINQNGAIAVLCFPADISNTFLTEPEFEFDNDTSITCLELPLSTLLLARKHASYHGLHLDDYLNSVMHYAAIICMNAVTLPIDRESVRAARDETLGINLN